MLAVRSIVSGGMKALKGSGPWPSDAKRAAWMLASAIMHKTDTHMRNGSDQTNGKAVQMTETRSKPTPQHERVVWSKKVKNWRIVDGADPDDCPAAHRERTISVVNGRGWGGVSLVSAEPFGEAEVHVELSDEGLHLLVYLPGIESGEPALNAYLRADGVVVADIQKHNGAVG
jgi:hypothetical protein